jgi:hypothetical protein
LSFPDFNFDNWENLIDKKALAIVLIVLATVAVMGTYLYVFPNGQNQGSTQYSEVILTNSMFEDPSQSSIQALNNTSWAISWPPSTPVDGTATDVVMYTWQGFPTESISFTAQIIEGSHSGTWNDQAAIYVGNNLSAPTSIGELEFGIVVPSWNGEVDAYTQCTGSVGYNNFQDLKLFENDNQTHSYTITLVDHGFVDFSVDGGKYATSLLFGCYPYGYNWNLVVTTHRLYNNYTSSGWGINLYNPIYNKP